MTWRDVLDIVYRYEDDVVGHPANSSVKPGCDCGCGGDTYSDQDWEEFDRAADETMKAVMSFCEEKDIEYTGGYS